MNQYEVLCPLTSRIFEMIKIATKLLKQSREDFFKVIKLCRKHIQKTNYLKKKNSIILGVDPFYLPLTLFISETLRV